MPYQHSPCSTLLLSDPKTFAPCLINIRPALLCSSLIPTSSLHSLATFALLYSAPVWSQQVCSIFYQNSPCSTLLLSDPKKFAPFLNNIHPALLCSCLIPTSLFHSLATFALLYSAPLWSLQVRSMPYQHSPCSTLLLSDPNKFAPFPNNIRPTLLCSSLIPTSSLHALPKFDLLYSAPVWSQQVCSMPYQHSTYSTLLLSDPNKFAPCLTNIRPALLCSSLIPTSSLHSLPTFALLYSAPLWSQQVHSIPYQHSPCSTLLLPDPNKFAQFLSNIRPALLCSSLIPTSSLHALPTFALLYSAPLWSQQVCSIP